MKGTEKRISLRDAAALCAQTFTIEYAGGSDSVWIRTPTQVEIDEADTHIAESKQKLRDKYAPGTLHYNDLIATLELMPTMQVAREVAGLELYDMQERAQLKIARPIPPDWDKYQTTKDREKAHADHEARTQEWQNEVNTLTDKMLAERLEQLAALPREQLIAEAARPAIVGILQNEAERLKESYIIWVSVRDAGNHEQPYFDNPEQVASLPMPIKAAFIAGINELGQITGVEIKNSQGKSVWQSGLAESIPEPTQDPTTTDSPESDSPKKSSRGGRKRS